MFIGLWMAVYRLYTGGGFVLLKRGLSHLDLLGVGAPCGLEVVTGFPIESEGADAVIALSSIRQNLGSPSDCSNDLSLKRVIGLSVLREWRVGMNQRKMNFIDLVFRYQLKSVNIHSV